MFILKKIIFSKKTNTMGIENFNGAQNMKKMINFKLKNFLLFKTTKHF